jgi:hypothetical protein
LLVGIYITKDGFQTKPVIGFIEYLLTLSVLPEAAINDIKGGFQSYLVSLNELSYLINANRPAGVAWGGADWSN